MSEKEKHIIEESIKKFEIDLKGAEQRIEMYGKNVAQAEQDKKDAEENIATAKAMLEKDQ